MTLSFILRSVLSKLPAHSQTEEVIAGCRVTVGVGVAVPRFEEQVGIDAPSGTEFCAPDVRNQTKPV